MINRQLYNGYRGYMKMEQQLTSHSTTGGGKWGLMHLCDMKESIRREKVVKLLLEVLGRTA